MSANLLADLIRFLPETILTVMGTLLMVLDPILRKRSSHAFGHLSLIALLAALGGTLVIVVGILTIFPSYRFLSRQDAETSEYHALLLFSIAGQCLMAAANELIIVFIGLEISSIASYVLAGYLRDDKRANEAALKYFLLGSFATAFFLYGVALIYGSTGTIMLNEVRNAIVGPGARVIGIAAVPSSSR